MIAVMMKTILHSAWVDCLEIKIINELDAWLEVEVNNCKNVTFLVSKPTKYGATIPIWEQKDIKAIYFRDNEFKAKY